MANDKERGNGEMVSKNLTVYFPAMPNSKDNNMGTMQIENDAVIPNTEAVLTEQPRA